MAKQKAQKETTEQTHTLDTAQQKTTAVQRQPGPVLAYQRRIGSANRAEGNSGGMDAAGRARSSRALQRQAGNARLSRPNGGILQTKRTVNQPGDIYEQEADRVAEQVMRMSQTGVQRKTSRQNNTANEVPVSVHKTLSRSGQPLDRSTRRFMESRFNQDFNNVRVHTDSQAAQSAGDVNARAYTVGSDVVFGEGQYQPQSLTGLSLIAHELAHTIQQGAGELNIQRKPRLTAAERKWLEALAADMRMLAAETGQKAEAAAGMVDEMTVYAKGIVIRLDAINTNYAEAYSRVEAVLKDADDKFFDILDLVFDMAIAVVISAIAPELVVAGVFLKSLTRLEAMALRGSLEAAVQVTEKVSSMSILETLLEAADFGVTKSLGLDMVKRAGEGFIGESFEKVTGVIFNEMFVDSGTPSSTISLAGISALGHSLDTITKIKGVINLLPNDSHKLVAELFKCALAANQVGEDSANLRYGTANTSLTDLEQQAAQIRSNKETLFQVVDQLKEPHTSMKQMLANLDNVGVPTPDEMEKRLWRNWMANLTSDRLDDLLDEGDITDKLEELGLFSPGSWVSDEDELKAVTREQKAWLNEHGYNLFEGQSVRSRYKAGFAHQRLILLAVGQRGTVHRGSPGGLVVKVPRIDEPMRIQGTWGLIPGDTVEIASVIIPHYVEKAELDVWRPSDFAVTVRNRHRTNIPVLGVVGLPVDQAVKRIKDSLLLPKLEYRPSTIVKDIALGMSPEPGTELSEGSTVTIYVSSGQKP